MSHWRFQHTGNEPRKAADHRSKHIISYQGSILDGIIWSLRFLCHCWKRMNCNLNLMHPKIDKIRENQSWSCSWHKCQSCWTDIGMFCQSYWRHFNLSLTFQSSSILCIALFLHIRLICLSVSVRVGEMFSVVLCWCVCLPMQAMTTETKIKQLFCCCICNALSVLLLWQHHLHCCMAFPLWKENRLV